MNQYILLAKNAVETYLKEGKVIEPPEDLPEAFYQRRAGVFISIFKLTLKTDFNNRLEYTVGQGAKQERKTNAKNLQDLSNEDQKRTLRGCLGVYLPTRPDIAQEIIHNAIAAATKDFRFGQIRLEELPYLSYVVYILDYPEPVKDIKELDPKKFGIIVKTTPFTYPDKEKVTFDGYVPFKTGLLLPDLEDIETPEKQFLFACQKAGINPKEEKTFIYKFSVEKFE